MLKQSMQHAHTQTYIHMHAHKHRTGINSHMYWGSSKESSHCDGWQHYWNGRGVSSPCKPVQRHTRGQGTGALSQWYIFCYIFPVSKGICQDLCSTCMTPFSLPHFPAYYKLSQHRTFAEDSLMLLTAVTNGSRLIRKGSCQSFHFMSLDKSDRNVGNVAFHWMPSFGSNKGINTRQMRDLQAQAMCRI